MQFVRSELQKDQELHDTKDRVSSLVTEATPESTPVRMVKVAKKISGKGKTK